MADDHWLSWQAEQAGTNRLPTAGATLLLFTVVALALVVVLTGLGVLIDRTETPGGPPAGSLCDQHKGRPGWDAICENARRH